MGRLAYGMEEVRIPIIFADLAAGAVMISSSDVIQGQSPREGETQSISLVRTPITESLQPGQIVASGDLAGILARVVSIQLRASAVSIEGEFVQLGELFDSMDIAVESYGRKARPFDTSAPLAKGASLECNREVMGGASIAIEDLPSLNNLEVAGSTQLQINSNGLLVSANATLSGEVFVGQVEAELALNQLAQCILEGPDFPFLPIPIGPVRIDLALEPKYVISAELSEGAGSLNVLSPIFQFSRDISGTIALDSASGTWDSFANSGGTLRSTLPEGRNRFFEFSGGNLNTTVQASAGAELELAINLGLGAVTVNLFDIDLFDLRGLFEFNLEIDEPFSPDDSQYSGPKWSVKGGTRVSLDPEFEPISETRFGDIVESIADYLTDFEDIGVFPETPITLIESLTTIVASPSAVTLEPDCPENGCDLVDPVEFDVTVFPGVGSQSFSGVARLLQRFDETLVEVASAPIVDSAARVSFISTDGSAGAELYPRVSIDSLSNVSPYAGGAQRIGAEIRRIPMDPTQTYLTTLSDGDQTNPPVVLELSELGLTTGDTVRLRRTGAFSGGVGADDAWISIGALFSSSSEVDPIQTDLVEFQTQDTCLDVPNLATQDIDFDFSLFLEVETEIPEGATHLIVGTIDCVWADNSDPNGDWGFEIEF